jgi:hypothetical protein
MKRLCQCTCDGVPPCHWAAFLFHLYGAVDARRSQPAQTTAAAAVTELDAGVSGE